MRAVTKVGRTEFKSLSNYITILKKKGLIDDVIYVKFQLDFAEPSIKFVAYGQNIEYSFKLGVRKIRYADVDFNKVYKFKIEDFISPRLVRGWREIDLIWDCEKGSLEITKLKE